MFVVRRRGRIFMNRTFQEVDGRVYLTYGITIDRTGERATVIGLSTDWDKVAAWCARLRAGDVLPVHLKDMVEDFLAER